MSRLASFPVKSTVFSGDFSIIAALPSLAEPINMDSETNVSRFLAMAKASSIVAAYCRISLVRMDEWDYLTYLFGFPDEVQCIMGKKSNLEVNCEDIAIYIGEYKEKTVELHLDYFGKQTIREII